MDHGTQYLSDHFTNQIKFWGIHPSYSFVAAPQGNGVVERFNRTLKEQVIHGRVYRNLDEEGRSLCRLPDQDRIRLRPRFLLRYR